MKNQKIFGALSEAEVIYKNLIDDYKTLQDIAKLRNRYTIYGRISGILLFSALFAIAFEKGSYLFWMLWVLFFMSFVAFFWVMTKRNKYLISNEEDVFYNCFEAYEKLQTYRERKIDFYLDEAYKALWKATWILLSRPATSSWNAINEFNEELGMLGETIQRKILVNLSKSTSDEKMQIIALWIIKLANLLKSQSPTEIKNFIENLRMEKMLPEGELVAVSRRMIQSLKSHTILWELLKGFSLFGISALIVAGFTWLLCEWLKVAFRDYIGYVIVGTITLFIALYLKKR